MFAAFEENSDERVILFAEKDDANAFAMALEISR